MFVYIFTCSIHPYLKWVAVFFEDFRPILRKSTVSPVLMPPTYFWTFCPYDVIIAGDVVSWLLLSLSWEPNGSRVLGTLVRPGQNNLVMANKLVKCCFTHAAWSWAWPKARCVSSAVSGLDLSWPSPPSREGPLPANSQYNLENIIQYFCC